MTPDTPISTLLEGAPDVVMVVQDPLLVMSTSAFDRLLEALNAGYDLVGPAYNASPVSLQRARITAPYHNLSTFLEVAESLTTDVRPLERVDTGCILMQAKSLRCLPRDSRLEVDRLPKHWRLGVVTGALANRFESFYDNERPDLVALVEAPIGRALDVGCAYGGYGRSFRARFPNAELIGVELNAAMAEQARGIYSRVVEGDLDTIELEQTFDLINCGEILEHLVDPWSVIEKFRRWLAPDGQLILSIPNAAHWTIVRDLLHGQFEYLPIGLTCVGHLRWYTERSMRHMLEQAGFVVQRVLHERSELSESGRAFVEAMLATGYGRQLELETHELTMIARPKSDVRS